MTEFEKKVYNTVRKIKRGRVAAYSDIACFLGNPRLFRAVGNTLNKNHSKDIPCHRVLRKDGFVGGYNRGVKKKICLLVKEGVLIKNRRVNLKKYSWIKF